MTQEVFVLSAMRTAVGSFGGTLKDTSLSALATTAVEAALGKCSVEPAHIGHVALGNVVPTEAGDAYLSRVTALDAGCTNETPTVNVNRLCGSGLHAVISAAQAITLGDCDFAVGAGAEAMSRGPSSTRWHQRMGDARLQDYMLGVLHDAFGRIQDAVEFNEAFTAQSCVMNHELDLYPAKVNPNGSGVSLGHPVGATGAIIATKALHELKRVQGRYALVTMCIGSSRGIAAIFERCY